jgi:hypothetical protein
MSDFETTPGLDAYASAAQNKVDTDEGADQSVHVPDPRFVDHPLPAGYRVTKGVAFSNMIGREQPVSQTPLTRAEKMFFADGSKSGDEIPRTRQRPGAVYSTELNRFIN